MGRKSRLPENEFFLNKKGEEQFYKTCLKCTRNCKQSFRITGLNCVKFDKLDK